MPRRDTNPAKSEVQLGFNLPLSLSARLDGLLGAAGQAQRETSRKELVAALISAAQRVEVRWSDLLRGYRRASIRDAVIPGQSIAYYAKPHRTRGPRDYSAVFLLPPGQAPDDHSETATRLKDDEANRIAIRVPPEIDRELSQIVKTLEEEGERTSRGEVVAALILHADSDPAALDQLILDYRARRNGEEQALREPTPKPATDRPARRRGSRRSGQRRS